MKVKCKKVLNWALPYLAIATIIYIIMYPQLISHGVILGTDSIFHFNRFYDTASRATGAIFKVIFPSSKVAG